MNEEVTLPPRQPNTFRTWLPRLWRWTVDAIATHPDVALIVFFVLLVVAWAF